MIINKGKDVRTHKFVTIFQYCGFLVSMITSNPEVDKEISTCNVIQLLGYQHNVFLSIVKPANLSAFQPNKFAGCMIPL